MGSMPQLAMARQKSKTEYERRATAGRKQSFWSAIQEVDEPTNVDECSGSNSVSNAHQSQLGMADRSTRPALMQEQSAGSAATPLKH